MTTETKNALDALDRLHRTALNGNWDYPSTLAGYAETIRTALKQSSAEVVTVEELAYLMRGRGAGRISILREQAEKIMQKYPNGLKIIRSEK